jgi:hypothetical protein
VDGVGLGQLRERSELGLGPGERGREIATVVHRALHQSLGAIDASGIIAGLGRMALDQSAGERDLMAEAFDEVNIMGVALGERAHRSEN